MVLVVLAVGGAAYATSGQGSVAGSLTDANGRPLANCSVERGLRVGFGVGGFDDIAYATGRDGEFRLPVNRGFNRLEFTCPGMGQTTQTAVVWRGRDAAVTAELER